MNIDRKILEAVVNSYLSEEFSRFIKSQNIETEITYKDTEQAINLVYNCETCQGADDIVYDLLLMQRALKFDKEFNDKLNKSNL